MTTCPRKHLHQVHRRTEVSSEAIGRLINRQPRSKVLTLGCDSDRAVVGVTGTHADAADGLERSIRDRDSVGTESQGLHEISGSPQTAGDDQRHVVGSGSVEVAPRSGERRDGRNRDVVTEDQRSRSGPPSASIENHIVDPHRQSGIEIGLDVLGRELEPDRDSAGPFAYFICEVPRTRTDRPIAGIARVTRRASPPGCRVPQRSSR